MASFTWLSHSKFNRVLPNLWPYLANETRHQQQHQDTVVVPTWPKEAVGHEGCQQGCVPIGLGHLHLPQFHLNCL